MSNLEEMLKYSENPKQVAKYFNLLSSRLVKDEVIERIEIEVSFGPKALVFTNLRILECQSKNFGTDFEIEFFILWESVPSARLIKGALSDDYEFQLGYSSIMHKCEGYDNTTSMETIKYIDNKIKSIKEDSSDEEIETPEQVKTSDTVNANGIEQKLEKLKHLYAKQLFTEQEYQEKKREILSEI